MVVPTDRSTPRFQPTEESRGQATGVLAQARDRVIELQPGLESETVASMVDPPQAMINASRSHELLVLGTRGLGTVSALFLGSVSQSILHRAQIPVVVLPKHGDED